jgi:hypothetical protein
MKLIEDMTREELTANHIKVYKGGHHGEYNRMDVIEERINNLELENTPSVNQSVPEPPKPQTITYPELSERLKQLRAENLYLLRKLNDHIGKQLYNKYQMNNF